jgi:hypothetical protein
LDSVEFGNRTTDEDEIESVFGEGKGVSFTDTRGWTGDDRVCWTIAFTELLDLES